MVNYEWLWHFFIFERFLFFSDFCFIQIIFIIYLCIFLENVSFILGFLVKIFFLKIFILNLIKIYFIFLVVK